MRRLMLGLLLLPAAALGNGHNAVEDAGLTPLRRWGLETWAQFSSTSGFWVSALHSPLRRLELSVVAGSDEGLTLFSREVQGQAKIALFEGDVDASLSLGIGYSYGHHVDTYQNLALTRQVDDATAAHLNIGHRHGHSGWGGTAGLRIDRTLSDGLEAIVQGFGARGDRPLYQAGLRWHLQREEAALDLTVGRQGSQNTLWVAYSRTF